jgi:hypothetical protein
MISNGGLMDSVRLSKSRFVKGLQCKKYLWWSVHDKNASEIIPDLLTEYRFKTGHEIGQLASDQFPGGFQVDKFDGDLQAQIEATKQALDSREKILYEASFFADHTFGIFQDRCRIALSHNSNTFAPFGWQVI